MEYGKDFTLEPWNPRILEPCFLGGKVAEQKFEDAFQKLESIVKKLGDGNLTLEESLKAFEEGVRLFRFCSKKLDEAEKKVEILLKDTDGRLVPKPFSLEEEG